MSGGLKVELTGSLIRVTAEAPAGLLWSASKVHELVAESRGGLAAKESAYRDIRERMALGTEPCTLPDCDWCAEQSRPKGEPLLEAAERLDQKVDALVAAHRDAVNLLHGMVGLIQLAPAAVELRQNHRYVDALAWLEKQERL
jgi:hypothetical protein